MAIPEAREPWPFVFYACNAAKLCSPTEEFQGSHRRPATQRQDADINDVLATVSSGPSAGHDPTRALFAEQRQQNARPAVDRGAGVALRRPLPRARSRGRRAVSASSRWPTRRSRRRVASRRARSAARTMSAT